MARSKGPNLASPDENPDYGNHVANVRGMVQSASPSQRISGIGWYRRAAQDVSDIHLGVHPGQMVPHATQGDAGITSDKPGTSNPASAFIRNTRSDIQADQMGRARAAGQVHAETLARTGAFGKDTVSHANVQDRPFGAVSHNPRLRDISTSVAAMSPAGPTGMTWDNNPRAVADATHLSDHQFGAIAHANTLKPGTPERKAASEVARQPFAGNAMNHQTTSNVEKGARALRGEYAGVEHPLGVQKTQHFANDIYNEFSPSHAENHEGMTGTVDKHQEDVIAGVTKPWGNKTGDGQQQRQISVRAAGEHGLPKLSSDPGYAYQRTVVQDASHQEGLRPKEGQAVSWVAQKAVKDAARKGSRG